MVEKMQVMGPGNRFVVQLALAISVMGALVVCTSSPSSSAPLERPVRQVIHLPAETRSAGRIATLFAGLPQHGALLGSPTAPVTLQFFGDLECKEARQFVLGALPILIRKWVRGDVLRIRYRAHPEETIWPDIYNHQQVAALAAGRQGEMWQYLDVFYHEQGPEFHRYAIDHFLRTIAREVPGLDFREWTAARREPGLTRLLEGDRRVGQEHRIHFTPAFLVGPTGGRAEPLLHFSFTETAAFDEVIEEALKAA
jgi:protein-disulfide isomerase